MAQPDPTLSPSVPRSLGATTARQYGRSRIGGVKPARQPKRCASVICVDPAACPLALTAPLRRKRTGMLTADCQCAACAGEFSPRGRMPRASADKVVDAASRRQLRHYRENGAQASRTPRLPSLGGSPSPSLRTQTTPAPGSRRTAGRSAQKSGLRLELDADADTGSSPRPHPPSGRHDGSAKKQDLSSKLQNLYEDSHASYSPRTMAIYSDRQQALRADPSGVAKDEAKLVANLARGRKRATIEMVSMPEQHNLVLSRPTVAVLKNSGADGGKSPRRAGTQANMLAMAEGYSTVGNYLLAEELLTAAIAECGRDGPSFELLKKRATAREKLARGQPAADNAVEFGILGEGWMAVGEHSRAAALFDLASTSRGVGSGQKEQFRKLRDRALFEIEQRKPREQRQPVGYGAEFLGTGRSLAATGAMTRSTGGSTSTAAAGESCGDPTSFFKHAIRKKALCGRPLLELLIADGDDFGIPPLRLVPGRYLEQLGRFPRSDEHEMVCSAVPVPLRPSHPTPKELLGLLDGEGDDDRFGVTFVSHRWARSDAPDTPDHAQCLSLIEYLNSDANPTKDTWRSHYFWIDWSSIDQDSSTEKEKMINALPIYLRCCNHFVALEWADYWKRAWCRLEVAGSTLCDTRVLISENGTASSLPDTEVALEAKMGGKPEQGVCTNTADLPKITTVVRHMQKMTWQAQGAARDARAIEVNGNSSSPRDGSSPCDELSGMVGSQSSPPRARTSAEISKGVAAGHKAGSGRSPSMRPMSFKEASRVSPRAIGNTGGNGKASPRASEKPSPRFQERDLGRYVIQ